MTTTAPIITDEQVGTLNAIQLRIGEANAEKGFHERGDFLRATLAEAEAHGTARYGLSLEFWRATLNDYIANRLLLVVSEVVEAHDEIRTGRTVGEVYYPTWQKAADASDDPAGFPFELGKFKPEGFLSEIVDAGIRLHDLAEEFTLPAPEMTQEKLAYNSTRPFKHNKKF